jgi:hypothetical protein
VLSRFVRRRRSPPENLREQRRECIMQQTHKKHSKKLYQANGTTRQLASKVCTMIDFYKAQWRVPAERGGEPSSASDPPVLCPPSLSVAIF